MNYLNVGLDKEFIVLTIWKYYVDNTFTILKRNDVEDFLKHLNTQHSTIQPTIHFTMETENDNTIPFLDTIGHKRFRRTSHYKCLQKIYAHWSVLVLWLTPPSISLTRCCQVLIWSLIKPPYIKGLSEPLCRCLQQHGITSVFTSDRTLRSHLGSCKSTKTRWSSV